jgi:hypothetical protein
MRKLVPLKISLRIRTNQQDAFAVKGYANTEAAAVPKRTKGWR